MSTHLKTRFAALDAFRGIGAICVVIAHIRFLGSFTEFEIFRNAILFVDFFFVLSGFVITHSYAYRDITFKRFFINRTFRIYPLHLVTFLVFFMLTLIQYMLSLKGVNLNKAAFEGHTSLNQILPNLLFLQSWIPSFDPQSWNRVAWSLSVEYYMYMLFFLLLFIKGSFRYIVWFCISIFFYYMLFTGTENFYEISRGLAGFFVGALAYILYRSFAQNMVKISKLVFSFLEILIVLLVFLVVKNGPKYMEIMASILYIFLVLVFSVERGILSQLLVKNIFQFLGKLSFSIYMTNLIIIFSIKSLASILNNYLGSNFIVLVNDSMFFSFESILFSNFLLLLVVLLTILVSWFTYEFVEVKGQQLGRKVTNKYL